MLKRGSVSCRQKNLDLIAVNNISSDSTGFEVDTNQLLLVASTGTESLPLASKDATAGMLLDRVVRLLPASASLEK